jgi:hypothetical protein
MADHFSGPRALADPAADITDVYAFPSPERPGHLVLVMNVFPTSAPTALFSDAITHRFRVRPITSAGGGAAPAFAVGEDEYAYDITFAAPQPGNGSDTPVQGGTCTTPDGEQISFQTGDEKGAEAPGLRIFAGSRLDPFFIDFLAHFATEEHEQLKFRPNAPNTLDGQNLLSIVVEVDAATVSGPGSSPLLAVVGETLTSAGRPIRIERMGRPEIKNFIMSIKKFDQVNRDLEIRDLYNAEDTFGLSPDYLSTYRARMSANLAYFDRLDGATAWPLDEQGNHPLTDLLLADFLVVDMSKPYTEEGSHLEIERALLAGRPHTTCGGRSLNDDIVDALYTLLVGGVDGPRISQGVEHSRPAACTFPYLNSPNPNPPDLMTELAAHPLPPEDAAA